MSTLEPLAIDEADLRLLPAHLPLGKADRFEVQKLIALNTDRGITAHFDLMSADAGHYRATFENKAAKFHYVVHKLLDKRGWFLPKAGWLIGLAIQTNHMGPIPQIRLAGWCYAKSHQEAWREMNAYLDNRRILRADPIGAILKDASYAAIDTISEQLP